MLHRRTKLVFASILYVLFLVQPAMAADALFSGPLVAKPVVLKETIYDRVAKQALQAHTNLKNIDDIDDDTKAEDTSKPKYNLEVEKLSEYEKRRIVFTLLSRYGNPAKKSDTEVFTDEYWDDLELFSGPAKDKRLSLFRQLNQTKSIFGEVVLQKMLTQPTVDADLIEKRQTAIKELVSDEQLLQKLTDIDKDFGEQEDQLLSFWKKENPFNEQIYKQVYFNWPGLRNFNQNPVALEVGTRFDNFINMIAMPFAIPTLFSYANGAVYRPFDYKKHVKKNLMKKESKKALKDFPRMVEEGKAKFSYTYGQNQDALDKAANGYATNKMKNALHDKKDALLYNRETRQKEMLKFVPNSHLIPYGIKKTPASIRFLFKVLKKSKAEKSEKVSIAAFLIGLPIVQIILTIWGINRFRFRNNICKYLQTRLIGVSRAIENMRKAAALTSNNDALSETISHKHISSLQHKTDKLGQLIRILSMNTFKGEASFFSLTGYVLAAFKIMQEVKNGLVKALEEFGEISAYCSMAQLMKKFEGRSCFVKIIRDSQTPVIHATDFWFPGLLNNPNMRLEDIVPNSIRMGSSGRREVQNILMTGPNTGGKSTILKGLITAIDLALVFGIALAKEFALTPLKKVQTYIKIADNSAEDVSLFKAELIRTKQLMKTVRELGPREFCITIFDEIFSGTNPKEAIQGSSYIAGTMSQNRNSLSIIATHFGILTDLEQITNGKFKNYKVSVRKLDDGTFFFPYTWEPGISDQQIALDLMRQEKMCDPYGLQIAHQFAEKINVEGAR